VSTPRDKPVASVELVLGGCVAANVNTPRGKTVASQREDP
jgi:hypothetical protein